MKPINYNQISKVYDDVRDADRDLFQHFFAELPSDQNIYVLDLGCGTGNYTDLFQRLCPAETCRVYGVEPSEGMLSKARQKNNQVVFQSGAADNIPFEDHFFDFVYMTDVIHHVPDIAKMFVEIARVLRPAGKVCIVTQSHRQIENRPIVRFFPGTARVDKQRYPDIPAVLNAALPAGLVSFKQEVLFEGDPLELGGDYLELVRKKGYSMLHLITDEEYESGLKALETALQNGPLTAQQAGETLIWLSRKEA